MMDSLWGNLFKRSANKEHIHTVLKDIPIFSDLNDSEVGSIEKILHRRHYDADEVIFRQGSMGAGMYIVTEGSVKIILEPTGKTIAELGEGEFFGEIALLDEAPRSATAVAITPSTVLGFFQGDLFSFTERNPRLGVKIVLRLARMIGRRLISANTQVHKLQEELQSLGEGQDGPSAGEAQQ